MSSLTGLIGEIISTGNAFNGTESEIQKLKELITTGNQEKINSLLLFPIKGKDGRIVAILEMDNSHNGVFASDEEYLAICLCDCLTYSIAILGTEQSFYVELHRRELIEEFHLSLLNTKNELEISELLSCLIINIFSCSSAEVLFIHDDKFVKHIQKTITMASGKTKKNVEEKKYSVESGIGGEIISKRLPVIVVRPQSHAKYNEEVDIPTSMPIYYFPLFKNEYLKHNVKYIFRLETVQDIQPFALLEFATTLPIGKLNAANKETIFLPMEGPIKKTAEQLGYFIGSYLTILNKNKE